MVSYKKASSTIFLASAISAQLASAHRMPKGTELKQFRVNAGQKKKKSKGSSNGSSSFEGPLDPAVLPDRSSVDTFLDGHEFIAPGPNDSRGPCPFINVMANHGFINRNGKGINVSAIPALAPVLFDIPEPMFRLPANMAIFDGVVDTTVDGETLLEIERLWNRPGEERDISQVFPNPGVRWTVERLMRDPSEGFAPNEAQTFLDFRYTIDEGILQSLLALNPGDVLTQANHNTHMMNRILDSCKNTDDMDGESFFFMSEHDFENASQQYTLPVFILGEELDASFAPKAHIEGLWREFRFPDGFAPRSVRFAGEFDMEKHLEQQRGFAENNRQTAEKAQEICRERNASRKSKEVTGQNLRGKDAKVSVM